MKNTSEIKGEASLPSIPRPSPWGRGLGLKSKSQASPTKRY